MTWLFDPARANATLEALEPQWGGDIGQRMADAGDRFRAAQDAAKAAARQPLDNAAEEHPD